MNLCGIISEFNPFHNGHEYIIQKAKQITGAEIVCFMSGDFVQRGEPAITDKYSRAKSAVLAGASAVFELPTIYACSNAENFAFGAIKIAKSLGVKYLAFGVENTNLETLKKVAKLKMENTEKFKEAFKNEIQNCINFNTALKRSIAKNIGDENIIEILNKPNNILAIEYLTAILKLNAKIEPIAIERCDNGFLSQKNSGKFLSASSIRELIFSGKDFSEFVPEFSMHSEIFDKEHEDVFKKLCLYKIRSTPAEKLETFYDYSEGIEYRIKKLADTCTNFDELLESVATARYRIARVKKLLIYPTLGVTKLAVKTSLKAKPAVKVLAISKKSKQILNDYCKEKINLIVTNKNYDSLSKNQKISIEIDLEASNLYNLVTNKQNNLDKKTGTLFI